MSVLLSLFPLLMCRFVVIAEFPLGCLVERLTRLLSLLSSLIDLFVDRKLVPRDLWTVHVQVGSVGRSTDVILIKSVHFKLIFKGWSSDFFDTDRFVGNLRCFMGNIQMLLLIDIVTHCSLN